MTIKEARERYDRATIAVYFSDKDELYKYSDLGNDYDDFEIDTILEARNVKLVIFTTRTPDDIRLKEFKQEFSDKLDAVANEMYLKYCCGKGCSTCCLSAGMPEPCFLTKVNTVIYDAKKVVSGYNKKEDEK